MREFKLQLKAVKQAEENWTEITYHHSTLLDLESGESGGISRELLALVSVLRMQIKKIGSEQICLTQKQRNFKEPVSESFTSRVATADPVKRSLFL